MGFPQDGEASGHDQRADSHGRQVFRLLMAVRMLGVRRTRGTSDRHDRGSRRHHVDDALQRVGIERDAARRQVGDVLDRQHQEADGQVASRDFQRQVIRHAPDYFTQHQSGKAAIETNAMAMPRFARGRNALCAPCRQPVDTRSRPPFAVPLLCGRGCRRRRTVEPGLLVVAQRGVESGKGRTHVFGRLDHGIEPYLHRVEPRHRRWRHRRRT